MTPGRRSILICFVPRSGSTFLCGLLASAGVLGRAWEHLWAPGGLADRDAVEVRAAGTTPNGVFAGEFQLGQWNDLLERERLRALLADPWAAVGEIARAAGVELRHDIELRPYAGRERQADALNEAWIRRFREEVPA